MMKILVIGLVYHLLLPSRAAGEPMVKVQMCSEVFENAIADSLNQIEQSELKEHFGDLKNAQGKGKKQSKDLPITGVELEVLSGIGISNNSLETTFPIRVQYGDKKFQQKGRKWFQNSHLFLDIDIVTTLQLDVKKDKVVYSLQQCDVYVRNRESNQDVSWLKGFAKAFMAIWRRGDNSNQRTHLQDENTNLELPKKKLCGIVRRVIAIMNENWKDYFIIDPSGEAKLILKSIVQVNVDCMELSMNLVVGGSEVFSEQSHDVLPGSGISLLTDYINTMLLAGNYVSQLNNKLEEKNPQLSPEELQELLPDVHETDPTSLKIIIEEMPQLKVTGENQMVTVKAKLQGFASKSDKAVFEVLFETNVKTKLEIKNNKLKLQFLSCGDPDIHDWQSSIGHSGDLDFKNLEVLIKKLNSGIILGALTDLHLSFRIPFWNLASMVDVKQESVEIIRKES